MNADPRGEAALLSPSEENTESPATAPEPPQETTGGTLPPSVLETLRKAAQSGGESRRKTLLILPGRFNSALAARYMPADWDAIRKEAKRRNRRGDKDEFGFSAYQVAIACEEILIRPKPGAEFMGLGESLGEGPVAYEPRLLEILGLLEPDDPRPGPGDVVRVLFRNKEALIAHLVELTAWQREEADEDEDEADPT